MKIASWNINSLKARKDHVTKWLTDHQPDVLMVQELKGVDFPADDFKVIGYESAAVTQKTYNGVAIFSKTPIKVIHESLPDNDNDEQARYLETEINGLRIINIYLPNGNPVDTEKYTYKLSWMDRLKARLETLRSERIPFLIGGDFNVIPDPRDCYDPKAWEDDALFKIETRQKFKSLLNLGLTDAFRVFNQQDAQYTFWDYQAGCWPKNHGIRIDHFLLSPPITDRLVNCMIDTAPRALDKPSDHTPIVLEIEK
ncbi:MAG: exodeoxyribonuclease III [Rhodospirillales bacterium]|nr:exodeoxyribonuclease III [Rhodospirillales bacterium]